MFFDRVTLASGMGADVSNGALSPAAFSVDGTYTSFTGLKWDSGLVAVMPEPYIALSGDHYLEFINLDGSVGADPEGNGDNGEQRGGYADLEHNLPKLGGWRPTDTGIRE